MAAAPIAIATTTRHAVMNACMVFSCFLGTPPPPSDVRPVMFASEIRYSSREGKGLRFNVDENSSQRAHASVKISRSRAFQIDKKAPHPGREIVSEELAIGAGLINISSDKTGHDLAEDCDVI